VHNPTYLALSRNRVFYFRWPIPRQVHPQRKASTLKVSLRTRDPKEALRLARLLSYAAPTIVAYGVSYGMQYHEIRSVLHRHFSQMLERQRGKMQATGPLAPVDVAALENSLAASADAAVGRGSLNLMGDDDSELLGRAIGEFGLPLRAGTPEYDLFKGEFYKAFRDYCKGALDHHLSLGSYDFGAPSAAAQPQEPKLPAVSLQEVIQKYMAEGLRVGRWVKRGEDQIRQHMDLLQKLLGPNTDVRHIGGDQVRHVKDALLRLPKNINKNPETRGKSLNELLGEEHSNRPTVRTINMYLQAYSALFSWAKSAKYTDDNPFADASIQSNNRDSVTRLAFTHDELRRIEHALLTEVDGKKPKEAHKWSSLISIYTGARLNEVCQLTIEDIVQHEGIWCFDFNDEGEGKHLKNESSIRIVPIHSRLIALGVLGYVDQLKRSGATKLFPEYNYTANYGWGKNLSVWFNNRLLVKLGLKSKQHVLHSLRHTMITHLYQADVQEPIIKGIVGHTQKGVTQQHYFAAGYKIHQLKDAIEKFG
jgi:integrase